MVFEVGQDVLVFTAARGWVKATISGAIDDGPDQWYVTDGRGTTRLRCGAQLKANRAFARRDQGPSRHHPEAS
jgi:hypothetical protein